MHRIFGMAAVAAGGAAFLALATSADVSPAHAQTRPPAANSRHICFAGEEPIYSCRMGRRIVSLCGANGTLTYHYGNRERNELTIAAGAERENIHYGIVVGQGGGRQEHFRFTNGDTQYIVYRGTNGRLADRPGRSYSGLTVMRGSRTISNRQCSAAQVNSGWESYAQSARQEPEGSLYDGWF